MLNPKTEEHNYLACECVMDQKAQSLSLGLLQCKLLSSEACWAS